MEKYMRNIFVALFLFLISSVSNAQFFYGTGEATNLENVIGYDKNGQKIISGVTIDPKTTATSGDAGSLILKTDGSFYVKKDSGSTTNWKKILDETSTPKVLVGSAPIVITQDATTATLSLGQVDYLDFNTAYSPTHLDGRLHYDSIDKTLSLDIDSANGVELQVGRENYIRAVNKTGAQINDGQVVYISGAQGDRPTAALAIASISVSNRTIGIATHNIADNAEGMVTTQGIVGNFNTSGFLAGDRLYLSSSVAGGITNVITNDPVVQVGWALNSTVSGKILVDIKALSSLGQSVVGQASAFYLDATQAFADNFSLSISPSSYPEKANTIAVTSGTSPKFIERFVSGALGRNSIPAGSWKFYIYAGTSNTAGLNEIKYRVNKRVAQSGMTATFSGSGPTRTLTVTGGAPFVASDANASILLATLIETPTQTAWISGFTSSSVVTVTLTDPAFVNTTLPLNALYYLMFGGTTGDINNASELKTITSTQGAFVVDQTDRIVLATFGSTDQGSSRNITLYHGGTSRYSYFEMPSSVQHNSLADIQGGALDDYYHLTQLKYNAVQNLTASGTQTNFTGDVQSASCVYYGDSVTNGSHRSCQVGGALIYQKRVSGSWLETYRVE